MIKNDRQYKITKAQAAKFERALRRLEETPDPELHPVLRKAEIESVRSQLEELNEEVEEYEKLKNRPPRLITFESFEEMLQALTQARIARGLSQRALGERLHLKEQQIQRYEANDYAQCSASRLSDVMEALGVRVEGKSVLPRANAASDS